MNNLFLKAIRSQEAYIKKPKLPKPKLTPEKRPPIKESTIMQILRLQESGLKAFDISKEVGVTVQTVYNVKQRYLLIDVKNGTKWYKWLGS